MFYYDTNLEFSGATLFSVSEANLLIPKEERQYPKEWWLRTPGYFSDCGCSIKFDGTFDNEVYIGYSLSIRPALSLSNLGNFKVGDIFSIGEWKFKIVSPEFAWLYRQDIGNYEFGESNDYCYSETKKLVDSWYGSLSEEMK